MPFGQNNGKGRMAGGLKNLRFLADIGKKSVTLHGYYKFFADKIYGLSFYKTLLDYFHIKY